MSDLNVRELDLSTHLRQFVSIWRKTVGRFDMCVIPIILLPLNNFTTRTGFDTKQQFYNHIMILLSLDGFANM